MFFAGMHAGPKTPPKTQSGVEYVGSSPTYRYLQPEQGIYVVRSDVINGEPKIGEGVYGTPVVLQGQSKLGERLLPAGLVYGFIDSPMTRFCIVIVKELTRLLTRWETKNSELR